MLVDEKDVPKLSLLDQLKLQRAQFSAQKELAQNNLNQLVGALYACDEMIKKHEEDAKKQEVSDEGGQGNGESIEQKQEQITQK